MKKKCRYCNKDIYYQEHHIIPREYGGGDNSHNLMTLCNPCHNEIERKTDRLFKAGREPTITEIKHYIKFNCWPTQKEIAKSLRVSQKTISNRVKKEQVKHPANIPLLNHTLGGVERRRNGLKASLADAKTTSKVFDENRPTVCKCGRNFIYIPLPTTKKIWQVCLDCGVNNLMPISPKHFLNRKIA